VGCQLGGIELSGTPVAPGLPMSLFNYTDVDGYPVCPTCGRSILPGHGVMRVNDCMIHASCYVEARTLPEPCEYVP
jgi:hypothetical protein